MRRSRPALLVVLGLWVLLVEDLPILRERGIDPSRWVYEPATGKVYLHPKYQ